MFETIDVADAWVPEGIDTVPPGYVLAAMLDDIDLESCSGFDRVRVVAAHQRMASHYAARTYGAMASVVEVMKADPDEAGFAEEAATAEVAAALRLTRRAADIEMTFALELKRRLPAVWESLCGGAIDVRRARVIVNTTLHLSMAKARNVVEQIIAEAAGLTTGQLGARIRRLCIQVEPDDAAQRYRHAVDDRRVLAEATVDGTANVFGLDLPPDRVAAGMSHVNQLARNLCGEGETRTMDQLRADVFLDLIGGSGTDAGRGTLDINVDLTTLTGLDDHPGELAGYGPVIADIARQVAKHQRNTEWRWTLIDPDTGMPIDGGIARRRPTTAQRRSVQARNRTCVHPGCRMPATDCDIDHRITWAENHATETDNLAPLCRHHHTLRHNAGWSYKPLPGGDYEFTTPLGHTYTTSGRSP
jgi:hypothetical protein